MEKRIDLQAELEKAKAKFSQWPAWKQHVLRNSMKGKVSVPRQAIEQEPEATNAD